MGRALDTDLRAARQAVLDAHSAAETAHDLDAVIATFRHPRYEIVPTGEVFDGEEAVRGYHAENFTGLPDLAVKPILVMHGDDAVAEEAWVIGTHRGRYHGLPPTGRTVRLRVCGIYVFDDADLICERVYYDLLTVLRCLGLAHRPGSAAEGLSLLATHPVHLARTFLREVVDRRRQSERSPD